MKIFPEINKISISTINKFYRNILGYSYKRIAR